MQAITDVNNPALTTLPLQQVHIYFPVGFLDVVLPKLTSPPYMMNMQGAPAGSPNFAQTENHYITLPDARMPHTPVCNEMYEAGLMNPSAADHIWYTHRCNFKLAVTMFKPEKLECCINSLSARRLVPKPAPASSTAQTIWLLTQTQMDMGTVAQQQQNRKVDIGFIQDPESVLRTDGCYCTRPRAELTRRLQRGEITGSATKCQLYVPKAPILPAQIREIFQRIPANMVAQMLQRTLYQQASQPYRHATPPPAPARKYRPYGYVPSSQSRGPDLTPLRRRGLREEGLLEAPFEAPSKGGGPGGGGGNEKREGWRGASRRGLREEREGVFNFGRRGASRRASRFSRRGASRRGASRRGASQGGLQGGFEGASRRGASKGFENGGGLLVSSKPLRSPPGSPPSQSPPSRETRSPLPEAPLEKPPFSKTLREAPSSKPLRQAPLLETPFVRNEKLLREAPFPPFSF